MAATITKAVCRTVTANPSASRGGHLSEFFAGVERAPDLLSISAVMTRSKSTERERRNAEERHCQQEKQTQTPQPQHEEVPGSQGQEAEGGESESPLEVDCGSGST